MVKNMIKFTGGNNRNCCHDNVDCKVVHLIQQNQHDYKRYSYKKNSKSRNDFTIHKFPCLLLIWNCAKPSITFLKFDYIFYKFIFCVIWPKRVCKKKFCISTLPKQKIAESFFATGSNH